MVLHLREPFPTYRKFIFTPYYILWGSSPIKHTIGYVFPTSKIENRSRKSPEIRHFQRNMCVQLAVQSVSQTNKTPRWARETSPGIGFFPPPASAAGVTFVSGQRKGREVISG